MAAHNPVVIHHQQIIDSKDSRLRLIDELDISEDEKIARKLEVEEFYEDTQRGSVVGHSLKVLSLHNRILKEYGVTLEQLVQIDSDEIIEDILLSPSDLDIEDRYIFDQQLRTWIDQYDAVNCRDRVGYMLKLKRDFI